MSQGRRAVVMFLGVLCIDAAIAFAVLGDWHAAWWCAVLGATGEAIAFHIDRKTDQPGRKHYR